MTMQNTIKEYDEAVKACRDIFIRKAKDYGSSWQVLRPVSIADQIFIKAQRIRNIQEKGEPKIAEGIDDEFRGIVNYGVIALIQGSSTRAGNEEMPVEVAAGLYDEKILLAKNLMLAKNHDYNEAWREMSQQSFTDLILMKLLRVRQILRNNGRTLVSEGVDANFTDIINYAVFALILIANAAAETKAVR